MLDVTISSNLILDEVLGIKDLRSDKRIDFVGGIRGLGELKKRVDSGEMKVALALYPVSMKQLMDIADTGNIMPPKTTWFEPKLRSGLVIHKLLFEKEKRGCSFRRTFSFLFKNDACNIVFSSIGRTGRTTEL